MSLFVKAAKKSILARLAFGKGEDNCLQATHQATTLSTIQSERTSTLLFQWKV